MRHCQRNKKDANFRWKVGAAGSVYVCGTGSRARRWLAILLVGLLTLVGNARGQDTGVIDREYAIKAAYLYHFSNYIEWPPGEFKSDNDPFVIGVLRTNPFGSSLERIARKKQVDGRRIEIRIVKTAAEALDCEILFVPRTVPVLEQKAILGATRRRPVLVVGETDDFVERGGNVQFYLEGNKVRFAFGVAAVKRDDLKVSSKLMTLAKIVPAR